MSSWWFIVVVYYVVIDVEAEGNKGLKQLYTTSGNGIISPEFITHKIWVAFSQNKKYLTHQGAYAGKAYFVQESREVLVE